MISLSITAYSQIGIGNTNPRGALDVTGNIVVDGSLYLNNVVSATSNPYLLVRSLDTTPPGELKLLDVSIREVAPVNKYKIQVTNVTGKEVNGLSTNLPTSKYIVAITDAVYKNAVVDATTISSGGTTTYTYGSYFTEVTKVNRNINGVSTEVYAINMDFKGGGSPSTATTNANKTWEFSLIVFEKALVKDWGTVNGSVTSGANYSGTSTNTPAALQ